MYAELFFSFLQVGLFSFGGGMVSITLLLEKVVTEKAWITAQTFNDLIAIAESTPGPIAVNAATFVGLQLGGFPGMLIATIGAILPGCAIVLGLAWLYRRYRSLSLVQGVMNGLRPVIVATIFVGGFSILRTAMLSLSGDIDLFSVLLFAVGLILLHKTKVSAVVLIIGSGILGGMIRMLLGL